MSDRSQSSDLLFVYGTLRKEGEHLMSTYLMERSTFLGNGYMAGKLYKVAFFPGAIYDPDSEHKVQGEIYRLDSPVKIFEVLDGYEGYDAEHEDESPFARKILPIVSEGQVHYCWVYLYNQDPEKFPVIESGDFLKHELRR